MNNLVIIPLVSVLALLQATAQEASGTQPAAQSWKASDAYPLDTCVVSGRPFAGDKMNLVEVQGRKFKLCSAACEKELRKDPQGYLAKLDRAVADAQLGDYPLDACPISGKKLGSMGEPVKLVLDNHLVQLCCKGCTAEAKAKKDVVIRNIQTVAYSRQKDAYPLKTCLNTGEELDPRHSIEVMHGPTLLRFCCKDCLDELDKAPASMLGKLKSARKATGTGEAQRPAAQQPNHEQGKQEPGSGHEGHGGGQGTGETPGHGSHSGGCGSSSGGGCGGTKGGGCGR